MRKIRKEKLVIIGPTGKCYEVGFLSPCTDGIVIGTARIDKESPSHLTILKKEGEVTSHITPQTAGAKSQWFPPMKTQEVTARFQALVEQGIVYEVSEQERSERILYVTRKMADWFNTLMNAIYQIEESDKEIVHVINIKRGLETMPELIEAFKNPSDLMGFCTVGELLTDKTKVAGFTDSKKFILPIENTLIGIDVNALMGINLFASPVPTQLDNPFADLYRSLGLPQYLDQEVVKKRFLEKLMQTESVSSYQIEAIEKARSEVVKSE